MVSFSFLCATIYYRKYEYDTILQTDYKKKLYFWHSKETT